jgi:hypothetical protein
MIKQWLERFLLNLAYGQPKRGERIYDKEVTFTTTEPKAREDYNDWIGERIHGVSERRSYHRRNGFNRLKKVS